MITKTVAEFLEKIYVEESFEVEGGGLGHIPSLHKEEEDITDINKKLLWSQTKK
jgi:hypothetical protein